MASRLQSNMKMEGRKLRAMERERQMIAKAEAEQRVYERLTREAGMRLSALLQKLIAAADSPRLGSLNKPYPIPVLS
jgi:hypothetical protein